MYSIDLLSKLTGLSKRTIRYYIEIGLLEPPIGACRGSYYTEEHLNRLGSIKIWTDTGMPVTQIKCLIEENKNILEKGNLDNSITKWDRYTIDNNIELNFKNDTLNKNDLQEISSFVRNILENKISNHKINF